MLVFTFVLFVFNVDAVVTVGRTVGIVAEVLVGLDAVAAGAAVAVGRLSTADCDGFGRDVDVDVDVPGVATTIGEDGVDDKTIGSTSIRLFCVFSAVLAEVLVDVAVDVAVDVDVEAGFRGILILLEVGSFEAGPATAAGGVVDVGDEDVADEGAGAAPTGPPDDWIGVTVDAFTLPCLLSLSMFLNVCFFSFLFFIRLLLRLRCDGSGATRFHSFLFIYSILHLATRSKDVTLQYRIHPISNSPLFCQAFLSHFPTHFFSLLKIQPDLVNPRHLPSM